MADFRTGFTPPTDRDEFYGGGIPWVTISDLTKSNIAETGSTITDAAVAFSRRPPAPAGSLLFSFKLSIGQVAFASRPVYTNEAIASFPETDKFLPQFGFHALPILLLHNPPTNIYGAPILNAAQMRRTRVLLPPKPQQRRIASWLDRETAEIDALIDKQTRLIELLDERRKAVITQAVTKGLDPAVPMKDPGVPWLGEVPARWKVTRLKFQSSLQTGLTLGRVSTGDVQEVPYLRVANVQSDRIDVSDVKTVIVPTGEVDRYRLREGDVLLTEGGDRDKLGRGAVWDGQIDPCLHQNHVFAVRVGPNLVSTYLTYVLEASPGRIYFDLTAKQSTNLASTNSTTLGRFTFGLPDVAEQGAILEFLASAEAQFAALSSQAARSVSLLRERRSALITAAVTGQIDVEAMS